MMQTKKHSKINKKVFIVCAIVVAIIAVLLTIAAFYDYWIDEQLAAPFLPEPSTTHIDGDPTGGALGFVYTNNWFARTIEIVGTGPCLIVTIVALGIFYHNATIQIKSKTLKYIVKCGTVIVSIAWMVYASFFQFLPLMVVSIVGVQQYGAMAPLDGLGNVAHIETVLCFLGVGFIFGVVLTTPIFVMLKQVKTQTMKELLRYAFIVSSASVIAILLVEIGIKPVFQRERFRFIYACGLLDSESLDKYNQAFGGFHPWYQLPIAPNAFAKGNLPFISEDISKSFPSGHETMAAIGFYSLVLLPYTTTYFNTKKWKALLIPLAIIGSGIVGVGRLMAGAHYLSDVTIGSTIAIGLLTIFYVQNCYFASHLNTWTGLNIRGR